MLKGLSVGGGDAILFLRSPSTRCEDVTLTPGVAVQGEDNLSPSNSNRIPTAPGCLSYIFLSQQQTFGGVLA